MRLDRPGTVTTSLRRDARRRAGRPPMVSRWPSPAEVRARQVLSGLRLAVEGFVFGLSLLAMLALAFALSVR